MDYKFYENRKSFKVSSEDEICKKYISGLSAQKIATEYKILKITVLRILKKHNIERRNISDCHKGIKRIKKIPTQTVEVKPIVIPAPSIEAGIKPIAPQNSTTSIYDTRKCPLCQSQLILRQNKYDGTHFFGCSEFPQCRHTESAYPVLKNKAEIAIQRLEIERLKKLEEVKKPIGRPPKPKVIKFVPKKYTLSDIKKFKREFYNIKTFDPNDVLARAYREYAEIEKLEKSKKIERWPLSSGYKSKHYTNLEENKKRIHENVLRLKSKEKIQPTPQLSPIQQKILQIQQAQLQHMSEK
ncbi:MAG: hypothetical protein C3F06_01655 [Candidatus Methanoperedenaceae archaeon]|nr:MAG: hypothetical protein C3F06_01655 [Candidatus Methanoperedenaceae archaeon]